MRSQRAGHGAGTAGHAPRAAQRPALDRCDRTAFYRVPMIWNHIIADLLLFRHPEVLAPLARASKDHGPGRGSCTLRAVHPSRAAQEARPPQDDGIWVELTGTRSKLDFGQFAPRAGERILRGNQIR